MSCSPFELKDYFLKELPLSQQREVEAHVKGCQVCREELDRLQLTEAALFSLRDEEIPQRIGFVSDKVFEPSPWRRWWAAFWGSSARLAFASAALLSVALMVSALTRMAPAGPVTDRPKAMLTVVQPISDAEIQNRIDTAVGKAVAQMETRQIQKAAQLMADLESARKRLILADAEYDMSQRRSRVQTSSAYILPPLSAGDGK